MARKVVVSKFRSVFFKLLEFVCLHAGRRCNGVISVLFFSPYNFKLNEFISVNCPVLSFLEMREFDMNHTLLISLVSAIQ